MPSADQRPAVIVVTGGTRGIGQGLARALLARGHRVVISGRSAASVARGIEALGSPEALHGVACEVTDRAEVQALWDSAVSRFGRVDHWINNAGVVNPPRPVRAMAEDEYADPVRVNLIGTLHGCAVAMTGMAAQPGGGTVWTMKGLGSDGRFVDGSTPYATTKYAITYLTRALAREARGSAVRVGAIQPGMVLTDLLLGSLDHYPPEERGRVERVFSILADPVEVVAPWIVERVLADGRPSPSINRLTPGRVALRFALAPFRARRTLLPPGEG